jgi:hypothetical protein
MSRGAAYGALAKLFGGAATHIGDMTAEQCEQLIAAVPAMLAAFEAADEEPDDGDYNDNLETGAWIESHVNLAD